MRIQLNGQVTSNSAAKVYRRWGYGEMCCPDDVRSALENCPPEEELVLELNSGGGSVYAGFEMYTLIRNSGRTIMAEVQSIAGSAMSVVMAACDTVLMSPVANVMIHRASTSTTGNSETHRQAKQMLETIDASILNAYEGKAGGKTSRTEFAAMMRRETFMTAQQAIDCGLADGMLGEQQEGVDPMTFAASTYGPEELAHVMCTLPPIEDLLQREQEMQRTEGTTGDERNQREGREKTMDVTEIKTVEDLTKALPELVAQVRTAAQTAERERIQAIDEVAMPGYEGIITAAKADPEQTAGNVAMQIIAAQKKQGENYLTGARNDANGDDGEGGPNHVPAAEGPEDNEDNPEADAAADVAAWKKRKGGDR
ncbi:MAG: Clp protease ClpP [Clostridiales bacterium]|nr:Clp protease ClpP [Clostridiales bacterium]